LQAQPIPQKPCGARAAAKVCPPARARRVAYKTAGFFFEFVKTAAALFGATGGCFADAPRTRLPNSRARKVFFLFDP